MSRRLIAAVAAILLAVVGTTVILAYVGGADQRALAALDPAEVLVVTDTVPAGTRAEDLSDRVALEAVPASAVAPGALSTLDDIAGLVADAELLPGEQLLAHRFVDPDALIADAGVEIPPGMHQITIQLDRARVLGGHLVPGDRVGVFVTYQAQTHLTEHKVLVALVQGGIAPPAPAEGSESDAAPATAGAAPADVIMVTLVLDAARAEKIVWAAENAGIWLSLEDDKAADSGTRIVTPENVYE